MIDKVSPLFLLWNELESKGVFLFKFNPENGYVNNVKSVE